MIASLAKQEALKFEKLNNLKDEGIKLENSDVFDGSKRKSGQIN